MLTECELWAAADGTLKLHGEKTPLLVAERFGDIAAEGDAEGVAAWKAIAPRMAQLATPPLRRLNA